MRIKYYGTAAAEGWPAPFCRCGACQEARRRGGKNLRTRSQATIDDRLLIDFPPDTYLHTLFYGLDLSAFKTCIVTHAHEDHLYRDDVALCVEGYAHNMRPGPFTLYGPDSAIALLDTLPDWARCANTLAWKEIREFTPFQAEGYCITPMLAAHGYSDRNPLKCFIYDIEKDGERLLYGNDTGIFPEATWESLRGKRFDLISLDCTMLAKPGIKSHLGIDEVLAVQKRLQTMGCADEKTKWVITHFSHNGSLLHEELVEKMRPHGIIVAYDGLEVDSRIECIL